jgi:uncharacterized membrane protein YhiD involved in acid resistance
MKSVNTMALMLSMLGVAGLFVLPAVAVNVAAQSSANATIDDNDDVEQENEAEVEQSAEQECEAIVLDGDVVHIGDSENEASNECEIKQEQKAEIDQANINTDDDFQVAGAKACEQISILLGFNAC